MRRIWRRVTVPQVQLDMPVAWHELCLIAFAVTHQLLGYVSDSDQHFEFAQRMAELLFINMREKTTGYLPTLFDIINRRHSHCFSLDYGHIILGLFNDNEWDRHTPSRSRMMYRALHAYLTQYTVVQTDGFVDSVSGNVELCCDMTCAWDDYGSTVFDVAQQVLGGASDSKQNLKFALLVTEFLNEETRDKEQRRSKKRCNSATTEVRPRKKRKLNANKKVTRTTQQVLKSPVPKCQRGFPVSPSTFRAVHRCIQKQGAFINCLKRGLKNQQVVDKGC